MEIVSPACKPRYALAAPKAMPKRIPGTNDLMVNSGGVSAADVAEAHKADLETQRMYGVSYLRYWVDEAAGNSFEAHFRRELEVQREIRQSPDALEGVAAFVEKRPAAFRGE